MKTNVFVRTVSKMLLSAGKGMEGRGGGRECIRKERERFKIIDYIIKDLKLIRFTK